MTTGMQTLRDQWLVLQAQPQVTIGRHECRPVAWWHDDPTNRSVAVPVPKTGLYGPEGPVFGLYRPVRGVSGRTGRYGAGTRPTGWYWRSHTGLPGPGPVRRCAGTATVIFKLVVTDVVQVCPDDVVPDACE